MVALSGALSSNKDVKSSKQVGVETNLSSIKSQNGVSSDSIYNTSKSYRDIKWYVLRSTYNRGKKVYNELQNAGFDAYYPIRNVIKRYGTRKIPVEEPLIENLIFVNSSRKLIDDFLHNRKSEERYIKYFLDRTTDLEWNGKNEPLVVDDKAMENFKRICDTKDQNIRFISLDNYQFKPGDHVLVVDGAFKGVEGRYIHTLGQWRVVIQLGSIGLVGTAYVPKAFVRVLR